jgi:hypothetical protein
MSFMAPLYTLFGLELTRTKTNNGGRIIRKWTATATGRRTVRFTCTTSCNAQAPPQDRSRQRADECANPEGDRGTELRRNLESREVHGKAYHQRNGDTDSHAVGILHITRRAHGNSKGIRLRGARIIGVKAAAYAPDRNGLNCPIPSGSTCQLRVAVCVTAPCRGSCDVAGASHHIRSERVRGCLPVSPILQPRAVGCLLNSALSGLPRE